MSDLRSLLDLAAGGEPTSTPFAAIQRRAATLNRRRRLRTGAAAASVLALIAVLAPRLTTGTAPPATIAEPRPVSAGPVDAGDYTAEVVGQQLRFTVPADGFWTAVAVKPDLFAILSTDEYVGIQVGPWLGVHTFTAEGMALKDFTPVPVDLAGWLTSHPGIRTVAAPSPTTLAGRPAHRLTITLRSDYQPVVKLGDPGTPVCDDPADCITLAQTTWHPLTLWRGRLMTLVIQDAPGPNRLILACDPAADAPRSSSDPDPIIRSLTADG